MLLRICEFRENMQRESRTFLRGVNGITFKGLQCSLCQEVKNAMTKPMYTVCRFVTIRPLSEGSDKEYIGDFNGGEEK